MFFSSGQAGVTTSLARYLQTLAANPGRGALAASRCVRNCTHRHNDSTAVTIDSTAVPAWLQAVLPGLVDGRGCILTASPGALTARRCALAASQVLWPPSGQMAMTAKLAVSLTPSGADNPV